MSEKDPMKYPYPSFSGGKTYDSSSFERTLETSSPEYGWSSVRERTIDTSKSSTNVFDVASYIVSSLGRMTTMKLQKLIYYCKAWSLVWESDELFPEEIEAWANGPVVRDLFFYHKGMFEISMVGKGNQNKLSESQKETIDSVLSHYGDKTSKWLIDLTHMEKPWIEARKGLSPDERGARVITNEALVNYYSAL